MGTPTKEIRTWINTFNEFEERKKRFELLISYDCSNKHDPFRTKLRTLLVDKMESLEVNESLYKLPSKMNKEQICNLARSIDQIFKEVLNEETNQETKTNVQFILPDGNSFEIYSIINKKT
jgi:hypothetical protein